MAAFEPIDSDNMHRDHGRAFTDDADRLAQLGRAARRRILRLQRQREAELCDYARSGIEVIPPGRIVSWIDADQ